MKFTFDGREFDTDKPVYVLCYEIAGSTFVVSSNEKDYSRWVVEAKRAWVEKLIFSRKKDEKTGYTMNILGKLEVGFLSQGVHYSPLPEGAIVGRSARECYKLYNERLKRKGCGINE